MSGASEARQVLIRRASALYGAMRSAATAYGETHAKLLATTDLTDAMQVSVVLILAAEALADIATEANKTMRDALAEVMNDTGCTQFASDHHSAHLSRKPSFVDVFDAKMIPPDYMVERDPVLDTKRIAAELKAGQLVAGCSLVKPNDMRLNIRTKDQSS